MSRAKKPAKNAQQAQPAQYRAAIYMRVSTEDQVHGYGLDVQEQKCKASLASMLEDWQLVNIFSDEGISGTKDASDRPALAALLAAAEAGEIDAVIVLALDRLARQARLLLNIIHILETNNVTIISVKERLDTSTPQGRFSLTILGAVGEFERDAIVQRTTDGRNARGMVDGEKGGRLPFGYVRTAEGVEIDADQAETVRYILRHKRAGKSLRKIAQELNELGKRGPLGGVWYARSIKIICDNRPTYAGGQRGESSATWPPII